MGKYYRVPIRTTKQEDDLWRVEAPALEGCWVDADSLEQGIQEIQEVIAMTIDFYLENGWPLPKEIVPLAREPFLDTLTIAMDEYSFKRLPARTKSRPQAKGT